MRHGFGKTSTLPYIEGYHLDRNDRHVGMLRLLFVRDDDVSSMEVDVLLQVR
jgi:hypothetical protein